MFIKDFSWLVNDSLTFFNLFVIEFSLHSIILTLNSLASPLR